MKCKYTILTILKISLISSLIFLASISGKAQTIEKIVFSECSGFEPLNRINNRIIAVEDVNDSLQIFHLQGLTNCCTKDIKSYKYSSRTLNIELYDASSNETCLCSCVFLIDISIKYANESDTILIDGSPFIKSDSKYLPAEYENRGKTPMLVYDAEGFQYENLYDKKGRITQTLKMKGTFFEVIYYNKRGKIIRIEKK